MNIKNSLLIPLLLGSGLAQASVDLGLQAYWQSPQTVAIDIVISGLETGAAPSLSAYDLDIHFDANLLAYTSTTFGDAVQGNQLDLFNFGSNLSSASVTALGVLNLFELSFDSIADLNNLQQDSFSLATLSFSVLQLEVSTVSITVHSLVDAEANALAANLSSTQIATVPLPAAGWLMLTGLVAVAGGWKRQLR